MTIKVEKRKWMVFEIFVAIEECSTKHGISTQGKHLKQPLTKVDRRSLPQCITWLKPSIKEGNNPQSQPRWPIEAIY